MIQTDALAHPDTTILVHPTYLCWKPTVVRVVMVFKILGPSQWGMIITFSKTKSFTVVCLSLGVFPGKNLSHLVVVVVVVVV